MTPSKWSVVNYQKDLYEKTMQWSFYLDHKSHLPNICISYNKLHKVVTFDYKILVGMSTNGGLVTKSMFSRL